MRKPLLDHVDVGLPHIAEHADHLDPQGFSVFLEKFVQSVLDAAFPAPDQSFLFQVVDIGYVNVSFLSREFVNPDTKNRSQIAMLESIWFILCPPLSKPIIMGEILGDTIQYEPNDFNCRR